MEKRRCALCLFAFAVLSRYCASCTSEYQCLANMLSKDELARSLGTPIVPLLKNQGHVGISPSRLRVIEHPSQAALPPAVSELDIELLIESLVDPAMTLPLNTRNQDPDMALSVEEFAELLTNSPVRAQMQIRGISAIPSQRKSLRKKLACINSQYRMMRSPPRSQRRAPKKSTNQEVPATRMAARKHKCNSCCKSYLHMSSLGKHIAVKHPEEKRRRVRGNEFKCNVCNKAFDHSFLLYCHTSVEHPKEDAPAENMGDCERCKQQWPFHDTGVDHRRPKRLSCKSPVPNTGVEKSWESGNVVQHMHTDLH